MYEVVALRYGTREMRKRDCYLDFDSYGEPDEPLGMDYFFWVLRNDAGSIVVDTGFHPDVGTRRGRTCLVPPVEALLQIGVVPDDVPTVVLTHLHYDHTGNVAAFPNAELAVQRRELGFWTSDEAREPEHAPHAEPEDVERIAAGRLRLLDGDEQVVPGVDAFCIGGHSPGQTVLRVQGEGGPIVLASDAVHYYEELELERPFAIHHDLDAMRAGYATVRELARPGAEIVPGHDPEVMRRFPVLDGGLGVRVA